MPIILSLITALGEYERLAQEVVATEDGLRESLFGARPHAEAVIARVGSEAVGFAVWFHSYSTFLARRRSLPRGSLRVAGVAWPRHRSARCCVISPASPVERDCGRMEWSVLDWNDPAIGFYRSIGARAMDEWTVYRLTGEALDRLAKA